MRDLVGRTLGKYEIIEWLGRGGMAEVYKAYHPKLDRYVTVKILHSYLVEGKDFLTRFEREARAVASLRHPHIVQIHDYEVEDETYYMVVEFIDGGSLRARMDNLAKAGAYIPIHQVLSILGQVADALDYAHRQGIIHRDIKPSNILLDSQGNAFLSDFGIARILGSAQFTTTGSLIGTPGYMSPEQALGHAMADTSDIYSLGVVAYELLTGKAPFVADTPLAILHMQVHDPALPASALRPDLPEAVDRVLARALAKDPAERYQKAADLHHDLVVVLPHGTISKLDAGGVAGHLPIPVAPTMRMEESAVPAPEQERQPGQLAETVVGAAAPAVAPKITEQAAAEATLAEAVAPVQPESDDVAAKILRAPPSAKRKLPIVKLALGFLGIVVVAAVATMLMNARRSPQAIVPASPRPVHASPIPSAAPVPALPYSVDFEQGLPKGWALDPTWKIIADGSNHVFSGYGHAWAYSNHPVQGDYRLSFRINLLRGDIHLVDHFNSVGRYFITLSEEGSALSKQIWPNTFRNSLVVSTARHKLNAWHAVEIVSKGSTLSFYVDGRQELIYTDPQPLSVGCFALETLDGSAVYVDDILVHQVSPIRSSPVQADPYVDVVVGFTPGKGANPALGKIESVLGPPDFNASALTGFLDLGVGGQVVVQFVNNLAVDGFGNDIEIYGDPANDEQWIVEASSDCAAYKSFGRVGERVSLDLATLGLASTRCIRITDASGNPKGGVSPGAELDAVQALNSSAP